MWATIAGFGLIAYGVYSYAMSGTPDGDKLKHYFGLDEPTVPA
jgi:hypothetical protein